MAQDNDQLIERRIGEWKRRLVDLSRRNRLLYYRPSRASTLRLEAPSMAEVFEKLAVRERAWRFWSPPLPEPDRDLDQTNEAPARRTREYPEIKVSPVLGREELRTHITNPGDLVAVLKSLHRRSRTDFEERGVRILHCGFGMLQWQDTQDGETVRSPLVLVPAELLRRSARDPFELTITDEEVVLNPALDVKLRNDFNIELPALPEDWEPVPLVDYLDQISRQVERQGWTVLNDVVIGLFSFHKLVIYHDLARNADQVKRHRLIRVLGGEPPDDASGWSEKPPPEQIDDHLHPRDSLLVLDADSSQLACIEAVKNGSDLVLHGPPGTGKSQTITNVIGEFIARGRTVLFVSEKMAALEVVHKRLQDRQLSHFSLELHSHRANKRQVVEELDKCLREQLVPSKSLSEGDFDVLFRRREQLREYVRALHLPRQPLRRSMFDVLAELASLHTSPVFAFDYPEVSLLTPARLGEICEGAAALSRMWQVVLEGDNYPWSECTETRFGETIRGEYERLLSNGQESLVDLLGICTDAARRMGLSPPGTIEECRWLAGVMHLLEDCPAPPERSWFEGTSAAVLIEQAKAAASRCAKHSAIQRRLEQDHGVSFLCLRPGLEDEMRRARRDLVALLGDEADNPKALIAECLELRQWSDQLLGSLNLWEAAARKIITGLGLRDEHLTISPLAHLARLVELCSREDKPERDWLDGRPLDGLTAEVSVAQKPYETFKAACDELQEATASTKDDAASIRRRLTTDHGPRFFELPTGLSGDITQALNDLASLLNVPATNYEPLVAERAGVREWADQLLGSIDRWEECGRQIMADLGVECAPLTTARLVQLAKLVELCSRDEKPEREWLEPARCRQVEEDLPKIRELHAKYRSTREPLMERYTEALFDLDLDGLIESFANRYSSPTRWVRPSYRRDRRLLCRCAADGRFPDTALEDLVTAREALRQKARIDDQCERVRGLLGAYYGGYDTDFEHVVKAVEAAKEILSLAPIWGLPDQLRDLAATDTTVSASLLEAAQTVRAGIADVQKAASTIGCIRSLRTIPSLGVEPSRTSLQDLRAWAESVAEASKRACSALEEFRAHSWRVLSTDLQAVCGDIDDLDILRALDEVGSYTQALSDLDMSEFFGEFPRRCASLSRWLRLRYCEDRGLVCDSVANERITDAVQGVLETARQALKDKTRVDKQSDKTRELLGSYYRGYETDFARVARAIAAGEELLRLVGVSSIPDVLRDAASAGAMVSPGLLDAARAIRGGLDQAQGAASELATLASTAKLLCSGTQPERSSFQGLRTWALDVAEASGRLAAATDEVRAHSTAGVPPDLDRIQFELGDLSRLRIIGDEVMADSERLKGLFGRFYTGLDTDWPLALAAIDWSQRVKELFPNAAPPEDFLEVACTPSSEIPRTRKLDDLLRHTDSNLDELQSRFGCPLKVDGAGMVQAPLDALLARLREMRDRVDEIADWVHYQRRCSDLRNAGVGDLLTRMLMRPPPAAEVAAAARRSVLQKWCEGVSEQDPSLRTFRGEDHSSVVSEFRDLDRRHWELGPHRVIAEANTHKPHPGYAPSGSEVRLLRQEALKQRRHLPIRKLFERIPHLVTRLKPCLLMSPLSVSQFLPADMQFDLVIFDEASQIRAEDAVAPIYRSSQALVCGDPKQLPPTSFFDRAMSEEFDEDDEAIDPEFEVLDSVLEDCLALGMPEGWLKWHYRSKHESLIAFSNGRFYDWRLVTFPSVSPERDHMGVRFVHVADGIYDRGGRRDNRREAETVVDRVVQHLRENPTKSLGVVAFSQAQMFAIEDVLELRLRESPDIEEVLLQMDGIERFFVKNLENVQGDERDVIIFSVGYGRDQNGRLTMNFGPLNRAGGERRLNVAVTRAREKVVLVSSIRAADMDLTATQAQGVLMLHRYLEYAEHGIEALHMTPPGHSSGDFESPLEEQVAAEIRAMGYDVVPQVGCSGFRIDLGVVEPSEPGRYVLGVECDGASYHSSYVARDKDRLRQQVLESLGWRIHRVWSPDWVHRRDREVRRLREAIEAARDHTSCGGEGGCDAGHTGHRHISNAVEVGVEVLATTEPAESRDELEWAEPYQAANLMRHRPGSFYDDANRPAQASEVAEIVRIEGPVHREFVVRRLASAWGLQKAGSRIQEIAETAISQARQSGEIRQHGDFLWYRSAESEVRVRVPVPDEPDTERDIEHISPTEIGQAMVHVVRAAVGISRDDLTVEVGRIFGFSRTGHIIRERVRRVISTLVSKGKLVQDGELLHLGEKAAE